MTYGETLIAAMQVEAAEYKTRLEVAQAEHEDLRRAKTREDAERMDATLRAHGALNAVSAAPEGLRIDSDGSPLAMAQEETSRRAKLDAAAGPPRGTRTLNNTGR